MHDGFSATLCKLVGMYSRSVSNNEISKEDLQKAIFNRSHILLLDKKDLSPVSDQVPSKVIKHMR